MIRQCPSCNSNKYTDITEIINDEKKLNNKQTKFGVDVLKQLELAMCSVCSLVYHRFVPDNINELYTHFYRQDAEFDSPPRLKENGYKIKLWESLLRPYLAKGQRFLDIGCAEGFWIRFLKENGLEVEGAELNLKSVEHGRKNGLLIHDKDFKDVDFKPFDIVFNSGYIEHVLNPRHDLETIWSNLKTDGILYTQTPDAKTPGTPYLSEYFPPEHVQMFSRETYCNLLESVGFTPLEVFGDVYNFGFTVIARKNDKPNQPLKNSHETPGDYLRMADEYKNLADKKEFTPMTTFLKYKSEIMNFDNQKYSNVHARYVVAMQLLQQCSPDFISRAKENCEEFLKGVYYARRKKTND